MRETRQHIPTLTALCTVLTKTPAVRVLASQGRRSRARTVERRTGIPFIQDTRGTPSRPVHPACFARDRRTRSELYRARQSGKDGRISRASHGASRRSCAVRSVSSSSVDGFLRQLSATTRRTWPRDSACRHPAMPGYSECIAQAPVPPSQSPRRSSPPPFTIDLSTPDEILTLVPASSRGAAVNVRSARLPGWMARLGHLRVFTQVRALAAQPGGPARSTPLERGCGEACPLRQRCRAPRYRATDGWGSQPPTTPIPRLVLGQERPQRGHLGQSGRPRRR
jgi:hypothetical protein